MAHSSFPSDLSPRARSNLAREKFGVILGFLSGLAIGIGPLQELLSTVDLPLWLNAIGTIAVVAWFTRLGLRLSR